MQLRLCPLIILLLTPTAAIAAVTQSVESDRYAVRWLEAVRRPERGEYDHQFEVHDRDRDRRHLLSIALDEREIENLFLFEDRLIVQAWDHADVFTIVDLERLETIDRCRGFSAAVSPERSFIAYRQFYPRSVNPRRLREQVLIYDLSKSPRENRMTERQREREELSQYLCGLAIYPEESVEVQTYDFSVPEQDVSYVTSLIRWFDRTQIIFTEWRMSGNYLVIVDIGDGVSKPEIRRMRFLPQISELLGVGEIRVFDSHVELEILKELPGMEGRTVVVPR